MLSRWTQCEPDVVEDQAAAIMTLVRTRVDRRSHGRASTRRSRSKEMNERLTFGTEGDFRSFFDVIRLRKSTASLGQTKRRRGSPPRAASMNMSFAEFPEQVEHETIPSYAGRYLAARDIPASKAWKLTSRNWLIWFI